jgi:hypothetical protein
MEEVARVYQLISVIGMYYHAHPIPNPIPADPSKKTIVVLGSGWASTSFLKSIDTELYNVVMYLGSQLLFLGHWKI